MGRKVIPESEYDKIAELYNSGMSSVQIGTEYGCDHKTITKILDKFGIQRDLTRYRKYSVDNTYFDVIDNQDKAYILGFLYADGNVNLKKSTITLSLQESDIEILHKINSCLCSNSPIKIIDQSHHKQPNEYSNYHYSDMATLRVYNKHMCESLIDHGVFENKSLILKFPQWLDNQLYQHFIRGYFDGDGGYCTTYKYGYGYNDSISITSTENFCNVAIDIIRKCAGISGGGVYESSCHNGITKYVGIGGANQVKAFFDWIYDNANLYLERKHEQYINRFYS